MAGVGDGECCRPLSARSTRQVVKPPSAPGQHALIHGGEDFAGTLRVVRQGAHRADQQGDGHGGGQAFAADVATMTSSTPPRAWEELEKIAAHLAGRLVERSQNEAGGSGSIVGDENLLHGARGFQFSGHAVALAGDADRALHQEDQNENVKKEVADLVKSYQ